MRVLVTADLHLDLWRQDPFTAILPVFPTLDALIIAGDLANDPLRNWPQALARIGRLIDPAKVFIVPGNHDYYNFRFDGDEVLQGLVDDAGMTFAQKRTLQFGGIRFLCATLWTDFCLIGDQPAAMALARRAMNDYRLILRNEDKGPMRPEDTLAVHHDHLAWLTAEVEEPFVGRTVIVTHHGPSRSATGPVDGLTPAFSSDLDGWILRHRPDLWLFGHTHRHLASQVGQTPVVNVSLGYPSDIHWGQEADILLRGLIDTDAPELLV